MFANNKEENNSQNRKARNDIFQNLAWPEVFILCAVRVFGFNAMASEKVDMACCECNHSGGQDTSMERKKSGECVVPVVVASDNHLLEPWPNQWSACHDVSGNTGGPVTLLIPGQQVTRKR